MYCYYSLTGPQPGPHLTNSTPAYTHAIPNLNSQFSPHLPYPPSLSFSSLPLYYTSSISARTSPLFHSRTFSHLTHRFPSLPFFTFPAPLYLLNLKNQVQCACTKQCHCPSSYSISTIQLQIFNRAINPIHKQDMSFFYSLSEGRF